MWNVRDGKSVNFWYDKRLGKLPLICKALVSVIAQESQAIISEF